ncbi:hypothetical protein J5A68_05980 [Prevotella melaninogenica]|jgi:hypothetical protein|uniref:hypothetical protein n=1 Tax=Prevotella melaninogenica TaxID=28132 RepID=UPI001BA78A49|nr:hypothetical protein [Prevotella melaninogenica]QUB67592.1 hypothetical protein J5A68_05980 [Prevotella melaninogenica]
MIKVVFLDEEQGWQSSFYNSFSEKYEIIIPDTLPKNIEDIWELIRDSQIAVVDYRLNGDGTISYTGDAVAREIHKHNKHFPVLILTSYEDNAIQECIETQSIRGKEMITEPSLQEKLCSIINSSVGMYERKKAASEKCIKDLQEKINNGEKLTSQEESDKYDSEVYLAELDMDSSLRANLINRGTSKELEEMISLAHKIIEKHDKR